MHGSFFFTIAPPDGGKMIFAKKIAPLLLLGIVLGACGTNAENVLTGYGFDEIARSPKKQSASFMMGEPFSLILKPAEFRDSFMEIIIYSLDNKGEAHRSRNISVSGIDTNENYFFIIDAFSIPFPGQYRISFEQLDTVLGYAEVKITP
jgi:hypothetical protein